MDGPSTWVLWVVFVLVRGFLRVSVLGALDTLSMRWGRRMG